MVQKFSIGLIFLLFLFACRTGKIVSANATHYVMRSDSVGIDSSVYKIILPYKTKVDSQMNVPVAVNAIDMPAPDRKKIAKETLLGNFLADMFLKYANEHYKPADAQPINFALFNTGGIRTSLPKGQVTVRSVFEILPFDNRLTVVTMSGDSIQELFNFLAKKGGDPVSGLTIGIKEGKPVNPVIQGKPFDKNKTYKVLTNDFCAIGGDYMVFFTGAKNYEDIGVVLRDAVLFEMRLLDKNGMQLNATLDNRIYDAE